MLKLVIMIALLMHGIGHVLGLFAAWTTVTMGFTTRPWLLSDGVTIDGPVGRAFSLLWLAALVLTLAGAWGLGTNQDWWRLAAVAGAVCSLLAIVPWWATVPSGAAFGAVTMDIVTLVALIGPWQDQVLRALR